MPINVGKSILDNGFTPTFDTLVSDTISRYKVPGLSIAVVNKDSTCAKGFGLARLPNDSSKPETLFHCASMTKAFTAAAISRLVDDNEKFPNVQWTTPVSEILHEDFILHEELHTKETTLEDILCHRTGLPDHDDACLGIYSQNPDTPKSVTRKLRHLQLTAPPRTKYQYSNIMYVVASHIVEFLTHQSLGSFLRQNIWEPLGMKNTFYGMTDLKEHGRLNEMAKGYHWDETLEKFQEIPWIEQPEGSGAGEMISSSLDMSLFIRSVMLRNGPLSQNAYDELVNPRIDIEEDENPQPFMEQSRYALGWAIDTFHGQKIIEHDGCVNGFGGCMMYVPSKYWGVVVLVNTSTDFWAHQKIAWGLVEELLKVPEEKRFDWDEKARKEEREQEIKSVKVLYPDLPEKQTPLSAPLSAFSGRYEHPGYGVLVVERREGKLFVDGTDRTWRFELEFEHAHAELWVVNTVDVDTKDRGRMKAQFRIGDGKEAKAMGIQFVENNDLIWFERKD